MKNHHKFIFSKKKNKIIGKFNEAIKKSIIIVNKKNSIIEIKNSKGYCLDFKKESTHLLVDVVWVLFR